jgi:hypothetical protein
LPVQNVLANRPVQQDQFSACVPFAGL